MIHPISMYSKRRQLIPAFPPVLSPVLRRCEGCGQVVTFDTLAEHLRSELHFQKLMQKALVFQSGDAPEERLTGATSQGKTRPAMEEGNVQRAWFNNQTLLEEQFLREGASLIILAVTYSVILVMFSTVFFLHLQHIYPTTTLQTPPSHAKRRGRWINIVNRASTYVISLYRKRQVVQCRRSWLEEMHFDNAESQRLVEYCG